MPWILVILAIVLIVLFYYLARSRSGPREALPPEDNVPQTFDFEEQEGIAAPTRRRLRIVAPPQTRRGKRQQVRIELKPLPALGETKPPPEKRIDEILAVVVNPMVYAAETGEPLETFDPPLTVTISYKKQDAARTTMNNGVPQLSIVTVYESDKGLRFEKLATQVTPDADGNGGTLTADLYTLAPNDPLCVGKP